MNILTKYIQMVITDIKYKVTQENLSDVDILIYPLAVLQIGIVFWVVVEIPER